MNIIPRSRQAVATALGSISDEYLTDEFCDDFELSEYVQAGGVIFAVYSGVTLIMPKFSCDPEEVSRDQQGLYAFLPFNLLDDEPDIGNRVNGLQDGLSVRLCLPNGSVRIIPLSKVTVSGAG